MGWCFGYGVWNFQKNKSLEVKSSMVKDISKSAVDVTFIFFFYILPRFSSLKINNETISCFM